MAPTTRFPAAADQTGNQPAPLSSVRRAFVLTIFLAVSSVFPLHAQFFDASQGGGPVDITALWRFHTGDDPQWASPTFDDSQWSLLRVDRPLLVQGYGGYTGYGWLRGQTGYGWFRIRLQLSASKEPLALGLDLPISAAEIYADGKLIGVIGRMQPTPERYVPLPGEIDVVPLPTQLYGRSIELAIRAWYTPRGLAATTGLFWRFPFLGTEQVVNQLRTLTVSRGLVTYVPNGIIAVVALVIGQISFGLFFLRRRAKEYAWAGLYLFGEALIRGFMLYRPLHQMEVDGSALVLYSMEAGATICWLLLIWGFMHAKADGLLWTAILLALLNPVTVLLVNAGLGTIPQSFAIFALLTLCIGIIIFARLVYWAWRGNRDARVFLVPFLLNSVMDAVGWIQRALYRFGLSGTDGGLELYRGAHFTVTWDQLGFLLSYLAIGAVLVRRFTRSAEQEQRLATEMESARQVQAQLVPLNFPHLSGFHVEAAYLPAAEVGGDFYQVFEQSDGSLVIVIGDVCGKGLKAAMTGVLAIGVARTLASEQLHPGVLLTRFNREMVGSQNGGFITCICARIARDGAAAFANAGHLQPYRNGEEIQLDSGLPLGITPDVEYSETRVQLVPGDSLTFLSDGVVEARSNADGFFGFDRMREISSQSARTIANAAQQFGQEDDITVLTLLFANPDRVPA